FAGASLCPTRICQVNALYTHPEAALPRRRQPAPPTSGSARLPRAALITALTALALLAAGLGAPSIAEAQPKNDVIEKKGNRPAVLRRDSKADEEDKGEDEGGGGDDEGEDKGPEPNNPLESDEI